MFSEAWVLAAATLAHTLLCLLRKVVTGSRTVIEVSEAWVVAAAALAHSLGVCVGSGVSVAVHHPPEHVSHELNESKCAEVFEGHFWHGAWVVVVCWKVCIVRTRWKRKNGNGSECVEKKEREVERCASEGEGERNGKTRSKKNRSKKKRGR